MCHEDMKFLFKQIPNMNSKPLSHDKKDQLILTDIGGEWYLTHLAAWDYFFVNMRKSSLPGGGNLVVVCNLTDTICSVASNGIKWVVLDVARTM